jgi:hypothetical protein
MHQLLIDINPEHLPTQSKLKKVWSLIKGDILSILSSVQFDHNVQISIGKDGSFIIDHQPNNNLHHIRIGADLSFTRDLDLSDTDIEFAALILAAVIRIERTYKRAFSVNCNYYPIIDKAKRLLLKSLNIKVHHNSLCRFIDYPVPGKRPIKDKPLTTREVSKRYSQKRIDKGEVQMKFWLPKTLKEELADYAKTKGITLEKALQELIPLGINIGTYLNNQKSQS